MKSEIIKKEIMFNIEMSENEVNSINAIIDEFLQGSKAGRSMSDTTYDVINHFRNLRAKLNEDKIESDLAEEGIVQHKSTNEELLSNNTIYVGSTEIIDYSLSNEPTQKDELKFMFGNQGQLAIGRKGDDESIYSDYVHFNKHSAKLIKNFILRKGEGLFYGFAAERNSEFTELDLYIDNEGNTYTSRYYTAKTLKLRYFPCNRYALFEIIKDGRSIPLNREQATILADFIDAHV